MSAEVSPREAVLLHNDTPITVPGGPLAETFGAEAVPGILPDQNIIETFEADLKETGCEFVDRATGDNSPADYRPFLYAPGVGERTFMNRMYIDPSRKPADRMVSQRHEGGHAILWSNLAAAHASPYNMASPIVLCPRDWGRLTRNSERATMAYNALLGFLDKDPAIKEAMKSEPGTVEDFAAAMAANSNDVEVALNRVARECLERNSNFYMLPGPRRPEKEALTLRNYYTWLSLMKFEDSNTFKVDYELSDLPAPIFVKLDDEDILQMGELLGLSAFGQGRPDSYFTEQAPLMWKHQRWQESMNYKMGILNSDALPTVREALHDNFGVTPEEFLEFSKNYRQGDKPLPLVKPVETKIIPFTVPLYN